MRKPTLLLPWKKIDPCPCRSGRSFGNCCASFDGRPRSKKFDLERPAGQTSFDRDGCYLSGRQNCGTKLTLEHPVSNNILRQFDNLALRGFPDTDGTVDVIISTGSAGCKVLCDKHNSDLSYLDNHAGQIFRDLGEIIFDIRLPQEEALEGWVYIDGPTLESFSTKIIAAHLQADNFTREGRPITFKADRELMREAILRSNFPNGGGLYICGSFAGAPNEINGFQYVPLVNRQGWLIGVQCRMRGFSFATVFDPERLESDTLPSNATYRGSVHQLYGQGGSAWIFIAWRRPPELTKYSRGELIWTDTGSSSQAPYKRLLGPPAQRVLAKERPSRQAGLRDFAPKPQGPVIPAAPRWANR